MEGLPHDFYITNYIKDISEGEYNKSTIEYPLKLQYFHTPPQEEWYSSEKTKNQL